MFLIYYVFLLVGYKYEITQNKLKSLSIKAKILVIKKGKKRLLNWVKAFAAMSSFFFCFSWSFSFESSRGLLALYRFMN